jgi:hypothetical protein
MGAPGSTGSTTDGGTPRIANDPTLGSNQTSTSSTAGTTGSTGSAGSSVARTGTTTGTAAGC